MYGCFVVDPNDPGADLGVVFFHNAGYSTACGHGTIALVTWALDEDILERSEGENHVVVDVPSGRLDTWAHVESGRVRSVRFRNVPAFVWAEGVELAERTVDVAFGGAFYAPWRSASSRRAAAPVELGRELKREIKGRTSSTPWGRAPRRLRRDLLAGAGGEAADTAQRHRVRGR
jgi:proline racemase